MGEGGGVVVVEMVGIEILWFKGKDGFDDNEYMAECLIQQLLFNMKEM